LFNPFWSSLQCSAHVHFDMHGAFSDHSPALVCLHQRVSSRRNFKFFNMWASYDQFIEIVSRHWSISVYGTPMYTLCKKLKSLKGLLKELNKLHFSHISERVSRLETELDLHQIALHHNRGNSLLLEQDRLLRLKLLRLKSTENMFFSQKVKRNFLKESDKGSRFFHALMSQNHQRNFIPAIQCGHGNLSTSLEEVGVEFV